MKNTNNIKDVLIIWTWPAGLSAAVYAKRYELDVEIVWEIFWWTVTKTHLIENWPWTKSISWFELWMNLVDHAKNLWVEVKAKKIESISKNKDWIFVSKTHDWEEILSKTIIYATWTHHRKLWIETEKKYENKWVSYCATCDWAFFRWKVVWIVWWSDSAVKESLLLTQYASKVYIIYRWENLRAEPINMQRMQEKIDEWKIEIVNNSNIIEIFWENWVEWVKLDTWKTLNLQWIFVEIWSIPNSDLAKNIWVKLNEKWEIITDKFWKTNIEWFFACWDVTNNPFKQAIVSASEWAHCANQAFEFVWK